MLSKPTSSNSMTGEYGNAALQQESRSVSGNSRVRSATSLASTTLSSSKLKKVLQATPRIAWEKEANFRHDQDISTHLNMPDSLRYSSANNDHKDSRKKEGSFLDLQQYIKAGKSKQHKYLAQISSFSNYSSRARPRSAMDYVTQDSLLAQATDPYMTVYKSEFHKRSAPEATTVRPPSQISISEEKFRDDTTYGKEFSKKQPNPNASLWSGGNNPHPSQAFMVWKYPTSKHRQPDEEEPTVTNEQYDLAMRGKCQSTYQTDFLGFPQGYRPPEAGPIGNDSRGAVPYTLDSLQRYSFQPPNQAAVLKIGTTRFSHSGADRHRLLLGGAPNASQGQPNATHTTTYDRHYNETAPQSANILKFPEKSSRSVKGKGAESVAKMYAESKSEVENMDQRYFEAEDAAAMNSRFVRRSPTRIPEPRWITTPVPAPLPS